MNKRQARLFAISATGVSALVFLLLTLDSHRQFPELTQSQNLTPEVIHGKDVWHKYNCINCHTLFGEGAYYAPDLTKITQHRSEEYLQAYMRDPSRFYDEQIHRRLMPTQDLSDKEIVDLIAFLDWVSNIDNQGWPPRPILVTGSMIEPGSGMVTSPSSVTAEPTNDPRALGQALFRNSAPACSACHSTAPDVNMAGPTMSGLVERAQEILASPDYQGEATDVEGYIRESIVNPSAYLVPGAMYSAAGTSFMPNTYVDNMSEEEIDQLVAYLTSLK
jgi:nitric oxide reductase subunit C